MMIFSTDWYFVLQSLCPGPCLNAIGLVLNSAQSICFIVYFLWYGRLVPVDGWSWTIIIVIIILVLWLEYQTNLHKLTLYGVTMLSCAHGIAVISTENQIHILAMIELAKMFVHLVNEQTFWPTLDSNQSRSRILNWKLIGHGTRNSACRNYLWQPQQCHLACFCFFYPYVLQGVYKFRKLTCWILQGTPFRIYLLK